MDCMHHLRNVWFGGIEKALTTYLTALLQDSLENIDSHLRVSTSMSALIRAFDKEFSLCANYPKGHGEEFKECIKKITQENYYFMLNELVDLAKTYLLREPLQSIGIINTAYNFGTNS